MKKQGLTEEIWRVRYKDTDYKTYIIREPSGNKKNSLRMYWADSDFCHSDLLIWETAYGIDEFLLGHVGKYQGWATQWPFMWSLRIKYEQFPISWLSSNKLHGSGKAEWSRRISLDCRNVHNH